MPARTRTTADPAPEPDPAPDTGGFFRNSGASALTVLGDGVSVVLGPGRIAPLTRTPTHRDLTAVTEADFLAQQRADADAADAAGDATPTSETEA